MMRLLVALAALLLAACGDTDVFIFFNAGTVLTDPDCRDGRGAFDFREQGGLEVLVVITEDTTIILASGGGGTCADVKAGKMATIRGADQGDRITASRIELD